MDVGPVSGSPLATSLTPGTAPIASVSKTLPTEAANTAPSSGVEAAFLSALSQPDLARLLTVLEPARPPDTVARADPLLQNAISAASTGDVTRALERVAELIQLEPLRAEAVRDEPGLEPLRPQVEALLNRLENVARLDSEARLAQAVHLVEAGQVKILPGWEARPEALLGIASRLIEGGGHSNFVRGAQLSQVVIDSAHWVPAPNAASMPLEATRRRARAELRTNSTRGLIAPAFRQSWVAVRKRAPQRISALWRRAPLLILLLSWLGIGIAGGMTVWLQRKLSPEAWPPGLVDVGFSIWSLGFLALVLFGFYMRVRNVRV